MVRFPVLAYQLQESSLPKEIIPDKLADWVMCTNRERRLLFFECPFVQVIWTSQKILSLEVTSDDAFWASLRHNVPMSEIEGEESWRCYGQFSCFVMSLFLRGGLFRPIGSFRKWSLFIR